MRKVIKPFALAGLCLTLAACSAGSETPQSDSAAAPEKTPKVSAQETNVEQPLSEAIDHVWAGQRVFFDFVEQNGHQMIAYYDANRQMSVAVRKMRDVNGAPWSYHKVPSWLGWDAHNRVEVAFDKRGFIHLTGNLHGNKLVYFRSTSPYDPRTLEKVDVMADPAVEQRMTYPEFFKGPKGELHLKYRDGSSGNGRWFYNRWNVDSKSWSRLHETVLLDGEDIRGSYPLGPIIGPDDFAHMTFTWRETPIASSNHDLSYARSRDLVNWETSDGTPIPLPIRLSTGEVIDPIPQHGGLLNGRHPIGFDAKNRVLVTYQKYDENNLSQVYIARRDADGWRVQKVSSWTDLRVDLDKSGALDLPLLNNSPAYLNKAGQIVVPATLRGTLWEWTLDPSDLSVISSETREAGFPNAVTAYDADNDIPQRVIPLMIDQSTKSSEYYLSWEALQPNRDQARPNIPPASTLRVHRIPQ
ncbi:BNR-4 repeat-containing protein [Fretibacter rubidus]|uniref:BNR repeat-containing protein n=1 Tax=Fretibacter rubidus TaxID=570162 RepID=UPI00352BBDA8